MDGNRRDSGCCPFFAHAVIRNLFGGRRVFTDECDESATCPVEGGFSRTSDSNDQLVRRKAGFHGRMRRIHDLSGERRVFTDEVAFPPLHAGDDLHDEKKQGRTAVGKRDEKVRADAYGEQD